MLKLAVVVGNPKPRSRTLQIAEKFARLLVDGVTADVSVVDLADYKDALWEWPSDSMRDLNLLVAQSDIVIVASPTYKASYTGMLKAFLDRYPANGLSGVVAFPLMTIADDVHAMSADCHLAPLLTELGAVVPGKSYWFRTERMDHADEDIALMVKSARERIKLLTRIGNSIDGAAELAPGLH